MKISAAIGLPFLCGVSAFTPDAIPTRVGSSVVSSSSAKLNFFFIGTLKRRRKATKVNDPTKANKSLNEKEVRALFELWNSAAHSAGCASRL